MIVSHRYQFIMIKTEKTAGTSLEIALSKYLGPDDIITPISPEDEILRSDLGYPGPQNHNVRIRDHSKRDLANTVLTRHRLKFFNHAPASFIRKHVGPDVWGTYFKFAFERNPWDKAISMYWYRMEHSESPMPINEYLASGLGNDVRGHDLYTIHNRVAVDQVYLYESLSAAIADLADRVGLAEIPELPKAKTEFRRDRRHYKEILNQDAALELSRAYAREIARFGYIY